VRYTALISAVCATPRSIAPDFYWLNLSSGEHTACAIFLLSSLNSTIGRPGETCVNFVTHLSGSDQPLFKEPDGELIARFADDFRTIFGFGLDASWTHLARVPLYSPVLTTHWKNPPLRSASWRNVFLAGNYRTFPSVVSTGTALGSGVETGEAILGELGCPSDLQAQLRAFRLRGRPRG
jgi:protoporphyrinogen oxidase